MKLAPLFVALVLVMCAAPLAAQSVTVMKPALNDTCTKGKACMIRWTVSGQPGSKVIIELMDKVQPTVIRMIASDVTIGDLQYSWTVPGDIATGQYRVQLRVYGAAISDIGDKFTIAAQGQSGGFHPQPVQISAPATGFKPHVELVKGPPVKILSPVANDTWNPGGTYLIKWTADTVPDDAFDVDLCDSSGTKLRTYYSGVGQQNPDGSRQIMQTTFCNTEEGQYRIRVTSWYAQKGTTSGLVAVVIKTKKSIENIPVQFQNATLECQDHAGTHCQESIYLPAPGRAGAGFEFFQNSQHYLFCIFRTRLTLDLSRFNGKNGYVESATMIPGDATFKNDSQHVGFCGGSLVALSQADVNTWNRYKVPDNAILYPLSGWSAPFNGTVDITVPVKGWVTKATPNLGFVGTGSDFVGGAGGCSVNFTPIMYVTFIEKPDPCSSH